MVLELVGLLPHEKGLEKPIPAGISRWRSSRFEAILAATMFVLLKLLMFFFRPITWIWIFFLVALLSKKAVRKKQAFIAALVLFFFFTNPFIVSEAGRLYEAAPVQLAPSQTFRAGIVLGGFAGYSAKDGRGYFNNVSDRFIQTALLYKTGHIQNIIVAAGNGSLSKSPFSEAVFAKNNLVQLGVPPERIFTDSESRNTLENALYAKKLADSVGLQTSFLLISSATHLPRAAKVFRKAGINATLYPCNFLFRGTRDNLLDDFLLPSADALSRWDLLIKEWIGITAYWLTGKI